MLNEFKTHSYRWTISVESYWNLSEIGRSCWDGLCHIRSTLQGTSVVILVLLLRTCLPAVKVFVCRTQNACTPYREQGSSNTLGARPTQAPSLSSIWPRLGSGWAIQVLLWLFRGTLGHQWPLHSSREEMTNGGGRRQYWGGQDLPSPPPHFRGGGSTIVLLPFPPQRK